MARMFGKLGGFIGCVVLIMVSASVCEAAQGEWIDLFNGRDLSGWIPSNPAHFNHWKVVDGIVDSSPMPSTDIYTEKWFKDFDAHVEFAMYPHSNAGLYLLGRYEVQMLDSYGKRKVGASDCGALYKEKAPDSNQSKPPFEWQTFDIQLRAARFDAQGRKTQNMRITVYHNGVKIHDNVELKGPTGSRKRYDEEAMGPILIQGNHGPVRFKSFRVRGKIYDPPDPKAAGPAVIGVEAAPTRISLNKADGLALTWRTPYHAYAPAYRVYRSSSPEVPIDTAHLCGTAVRRSLTDCDFEADGTFYYRVVALGAEGKAGPASEVIHAKAPANQVATPILSDASWSYVRSNGTPRRNRSYGGKPITLHGKRFAKGIGVRGGTTIRMNVGKMVGRRPGYRFRSTIGLDDSMRASRRAVAASQFIVKLDGKTVFDSGTLKWSDGPRDIDLPVPAGTRKLELTVNYKGRRSTDYADWANARIEQGGAGR